MLAHLEYLKTARPTAVNLSEACDRLAAKLRTPDFKPADVRAECVRFARDMLQADVEMNRSIGKHGAQWLLASRVDNNNTPVSVLTHCNTGTLATAGYGTALGIIRALHESKMLERVWCTETRPYNQGSRLTAYELVVDGLPMPTLICDSMASALFRARQKQGHPISAVIVGADRVAANGDTANKVGTYQLALVARAHGAHFVVAAPSTSIDLSIKHGDEIVIEERPAEELTSVEGWVPAGPHGMGFLQCVQVAAPGIQVWNPAFGM